MKIVICDDEKIYVDKVYEKVKVYCNDDEVSCYENADMLLNDIENNAINSDIYIMDIEMDNINGLDIAKKIREKDTSALIIFLTNYDKYVYDAFEVKTFRYIPKERIDEKLPQAIKDAVVRIKERNSKNIYVGVSGRVIRRIELDEIVFIEKYQKNIIFNLLDKSTVRERTTLKNIYTELDSDKFIFINKGIIINLKNIKYLDGLRIVMENDVECYISRDRLKEVKDKITNFWG